MSHFPVHIDGHEFGDRAALVEALHAWGSGRRRRHRGDRHSADRFNHAVGAHSPAAPALAEAAAELLRTSEDPGVLELIAHLSLPATSDALYDALVGRLEGQGAPLPTGQGLRHRTLREELLHLLGQWLPDGQPALADRARAVLEASGSPEAALAFSCRTLDGADDLAAALRAVPDLNRDPYLAVYVIAHVIKHHPDRALEVAKVLREVKAPEEIRQLVGREIAEIHPDWHQKFGASLSTVLAIS